MTLLTNSIPNLVNGVSQQPESIRLNSQAEEQVNGLSSVSKGLSQRPGSRFVASLGALPSDAMLHTINRDPTEQYQVVVTNGQIKVWDINGVEQTVVAPNGWGYLATGSAKTDIRCLTVADYTFVLNTSVATQAMAATTPQRDVEALVWVKQGTYGGNYNVFIGSEGGASFTVADGSDSSHVSSVRTSNIANQLSSSLSSSLGTGWTLSTLGSTIYIKRDDGNDFDLSTSDSLGDNGISAIKQRVQRFSDLPAKAVDGFAVEIFGDNSSSFDNYYLSYSTEGTATSDGYWEEAAKGGEAYQIDASTMPHGLVRQANGTFSFEPIDWADRTVGDLKGNPMPSFVGRKINDMFFHRNRLGFVSDENIILSRSGQFFNFFAQTATAVLDDDPIDVGVSHVKVSILRHAIPFNQSLLLFSDQTQFQLGYADTLTPRTISVNQTTEFEASLRTKPVGVGKYVYFTVNKGSYTGVREYYMDPLTESEDSRDVTDHVPSYIPEGVFKMAASVNNDIIVALSEKTPNSLYVYRYFWSGDEKLQSSWSRWDFGEGDDILNVDFIESRLYMVINRVDGAYLEVINLDEAFSEDGWDFQAHLDSVLVDEDFVSKTFDPNASEFTDGATTVTLPYLLSPEDAESLVAVTLPGGGMIPGRVLERVVTDFNGASQVIVQGDLTSQPLVIGKKYEFRYTFSPFKMQTEAAGGGLVTMNEGRLQVRKASVTFDESGAFQVEVKPQGRQQYKYDYSGWTIGSDATSIGGIPKGSGVFNFPVLAQNDSVKIELVSDSYLPCNFLGAQWEGFFHARSRRR